MTTVLAGLRCSNTSAAVLQSAKLGDNLERVVVEMLGLCRAAGRRKRQRDG